MRELFAVSDVLCDSELMRGSEVRASCESMRGRGRRKRSSLKKKKEEGRGSGLKQKTRDNPRSAEVQLDTGDSSFGGWKTKRTVVEGDEGRRNARGVVQAAPGGEEEGIRLSW
jgi:hypothetical protein